MPDKCVAYRKDLPMESKDYSEIRAAVRKLCGDFPREYWRELDRERGYPSEFVSALTRAGFLSVLIPEQYGGAGLAAFGSRGNP